MKKRQSKHTTRGTDKKGETKERHITRKKTRKRHRHKRQDTNNKDTAMTMPTLRERAKEIDKPKDGDKAKQTQERWTKRHKASIQRQRTRNETGEATPPKQDKGKGQRNIYWSC